MESVIRHHPATGHRMLARRVAIPVTGLSFGAVFWLYGAGVVGVAVAVAFVGIWLYRNEVRRRHGIDCPNCGQRTGAALKIQMAGEEERMVYPCDFCAVGVDVGISSDKK